MALHCQCNFKGIIFRLQFAVLIFFIAHALFEFQSRGYTVANDCVQMMKASLRIPEVPADKNKPLCRRQSWNITVAKLQTTYAAER